MKPQLLLPMLFVAGAMGASALSCGTVASPGACVLNAGGQVQYTFSNFALAANSATGTQLVTGADIALNLTAGPGLGAVLSMTKIATAANPNVVFLANAGNTNSFSFTYNVAIAPLTPGSVQFIDPAEVMLNTSSFSGNGNAAVQFVIPGAPVCLAFSTSTADSCNLPAGATTSLPGLGNIVSISGNAGNASIGTFSNRLNASYSAAPAGVPEPATYALFAAGLAVIYRLRRR